MKAWHISTDEGPYATVIFAETAGKAKSYALHCDACEDARFTDIICRRYPQADKAYRGVFEMDWENATDRMFLVKECGWSCAYDFVGDECDICPTSEYCDAYKALKERDNNA